MKSPLARKTIREMSGYTPGEQPPAGARVVKLNTNENPFPPSENVMRAIREITPDALRRYPDPLANAFRAAAARVHGVQPEMIIAGNGSDDILTIATRTFIPPGGALAFPEPTYSLYPVLAQLQDAKFAVVDWEKNWSLPIDALLATKADAIYLANPNAPSGTFVPPVKVAELAEKFAGLLLVDEAYADFAEGNCMSLVSRFSNVIVSRTMSKAYSLAGLRFGYAVAQEQIIAEMMKVKDSYNCDAISIVAAAAALEDQEYAAKTWDYVRSERQRISAELTKLAFAVPPSQANFVLATCPDGDGRHIYQSLKDRGILVRYFDLPGLRDKLRITIGIKEDNDALLAAIKSIVDQTQRSPASRK
ncbi:MAG TPA: histidinol-phosphate transaminase [Tepidisphaeraceae bacterium]|nr:histidinol-phosphate transaminase [Tepidisphaeraceae bacterium]